MDIHVLINLWKSQILNLENKTQHSTTVPLPTYSKLQSFPFFDTHHQTQLTARKAY